GGGDDLDPLGGGQFPLGEDPAHVVVEDLRGSAGKGVESGFAGPEQPFADREVGAGHAVHDLHGAERVDVHVGGPLPDCPGDVEVGGSRQVGVDPALHAHFGGPGLPRFGGPVCDLFEGEGVGVGVGAALRKSAEPASRVADVGEVDVAGDDEGDLVAHGVAADPVGEVGERFQFGAVRGEQGQGVAVGDPGRIVFGTAQGGTDLRVEPVGCPRVAGGLGDACAEFRPVAVDGVEVAAPVAAAACGVDVLVEVGPTPGFEAGGLLPGAPSDDGVGAGQPGLRVGEDSDVVVEARVDPRFALAHVFGVDGEAFPEGEACRGSAFGEQVDLRPGAFRVDMVGGER